MNNWKCVHTYRLLKSSEVDSDGALISSRTKRRHSNVGNGRDHHKCGEVVQKDCHEEVA